MRRIFREVCYDLREPGVHIWMIPPAALLFLIGAYFVQRALDATGRVNIITLASLEVIIPAIGGYGAMMLMQGLLDDTEGGEIAFTYRRSNMYWGLARQFRFFALFAILVGLVCAGVSCMMHISFLPVYCLTLAQCFAVMGVAFLGIASSRKAAIGLIALVAFIGVQLTLGREYPALDFIYALDGMVPSPERQNGLICACLVIGGFGWGIGQIWVRP